MHCATANANGFRRSRSNHCDSAWESWSNYHGQTMRPPTTVGQKAGHGSAAESCLYSSIKRRWLKSGNISQQSGTHICIYRLSQLNVVRLLLYFHSAISSFPVCVFSYEYRKPPISLNCVQNTWKGIFLFVCLCFFFFSFSLHNHST